MYTVLRISWLNLIRDKAALALTFLLPIAFFSIFAVIFGGMMGEGGRLPTVQVIVVDEDQSSASARFAEAVEDESALTLVAPPADELDGQWTVEAAQQAVRQGKAAVAIIIPQGFGETFGTFSPDAVPAQLYYDEANPVAPQMVSGLMQKAAMTAAPDLFIERGLDMLDQYGGGLTATQRTAMDAFLSRLREWLNQTNAAKDSETEAASDSNANNDAAVFTGPVRVVMAGIRQAEQKQQQRRSIIAFYAAGIGVMFLLFSVTGAGGTLLEEEESGALERVLMSNVGMTKLLLGKWLFISMMGMAQLTIMFIWGWAVFGLELWTAKHVAGFAVMTVLTATAASGFGMMLAAACRSRNQLNGMSTVVILVMSALGGSMIPRFVLAQDPLMEKLGLLTFNAWALDGYHKVFWYELASDSLLQSLLRLWPQALVLIALAIVFLCIARLLARRWEAV